MHNEINLTIKDLLNNEGNKLRLVILYLLNFISIISLEILYKYNTSGSIEFKMIYTIILFSLLLSSVITILYLILPNNVRKPLLEVFYVMLVFVFFNASYAYKSSPQIVNFYNYFDYYYLQELYNSYTFDIIQILYILPIIITIWLPNFDSKIRLRSISLAIKPTLIVYFLFVLSMVIGTNTLIDLQNSNNITSESYKYGLNMTILDNFDNSDNTSQIDVYNFLKEDNIPRDGFMSGLYENKNYIFLDLQGLDLTFINTDVMPYLTQYMSASTYFSNYYVAPTKKTETSYFMMDTGLYPSDGANNNTYTKLSNVEGKDLTSGFNKQGYVTSSYNNISPSLYRYASYSNFDYNTSYDVDSYSMINDIVNTLNTSKNFYMRITAQNNALSTNIRDEFKDLDISESLMHYYSYFYQLDYAIKLLEEKLIETGHLDDTVVCVTNTLLDNDISSDIIKLDSTRTSYDYYKAPLIFIDFSGGNQVRTTSGLVEYYAGIVDVFGLSSLAIDDCINYSIYFNPDNNTMFLDGTVVSSNYYYSTKSCTYFSEDYQYYKSGDKYESALNQISNIYQRYQISQIAINTRYYRSELI